MRRRRQNAASAVLLQATTCRVVTTLGCEIWRVEIEKKNGYRKTRDRVRVKNDNNKLYSHRENITRKTERYFVVYIIIYYYMSVRRQIGWLRIWVDVRVTRHRINNNMTSPTWKWMYKTVYEVVGTGWEGERT